MLKKIYARYGRKFQPEELQRYLDLQPWYEALYEAEDFDTNYSNRLLNDFGNKNVEFLKKEEGSMAPGGYELDTK